MRNLDKNFRTSGIGRTTVQAGTRRPRATRTTASLPPAGVDLIAPTTDLRIPSLAGIPASYTHLSGTKLLYHLCRALVEHGAGDGEIWQAVEGNPLKFVQSSLSRWIDTRGGEVIGDYIGYELSVVSDPDRYSKGGKGNVAERELYLTVQCDTCGYLMVGAALEAMEAEVTGLGAAFYSVLLSSLYRWMRIWNHSDAEYMIEMQREWAISEANGTENPEEALKQYEFPDMEKVVPPYARRRDVTSLRKNVALLSEHRSGKYSEWIKRLLAIHRFARQKPTRSVRGEIEGYYEDDPLPALLIVFERHDAIEQTFDEASQSMYEVEHAPLVSCRINPANSGDVRGALRTLGIFLGLNRELCGLIDSLNQFQEKVRECPSGNRNEPPLCAA
jgi:hypothetical protein